MRHYSRVLLPAKWGSAVILRSGNPKLRMSLVGHFRRTTRIRRSRHVRFAPIASESSHRSESTRCATTGTHALQQKASLFNNLVGEQLNRVGHLDVECFGGVQIDDELECGRLQNREVGRFLALENPSDVHAD
jgi:hypothetical protein